MLPAASPGICPPQARLVRVGRRGRSLLAQLPSVSRVSHPIPADLHCPVKGSQPPFLRCSRAFI